MIIERPPKLFRLLFPKALFRIKGEGKRVYLTFDDGPIPEVTPWVLDLLDHYGIKATFFMVGDNVKKHPEEAVEVINRGHAIGNHTMHHLQGSKVTTRHYMRDVKEADEFVSSRLFRPPHGWLRPAMAMALRKEFTVVMYDLITRDYSKRLSWQQVFENVKRYTRNGSIIVFHDSLKSRERLYEALPRSIEWLISEGYEFATIEPR